MARLLVVEDEPLVYDVFKTVFDLRGGYLLEHAADGEVALAALARRPLPELAIIDVKLPKLSGIAVAKHAARQAVPVILMSGHPDTIADPTPSFPVLAKPFRIGDLADRVDQLVAEAKLLQEELSQSMQLSESLLQRSEDAGRASLEQLSQHWLLVCHRLLGHMSSTG